MTNVFEASANIEKGDKQIKSEKEKCIEAFEYASKVSPFIDNHLDASFCANLSDNLKQKEKKISKPPIIRSTIHTTPKSPQQSDTLQKPQQEQQQQQQQQNYSKPKYEHEELLNRVGNDITSFLEVESKQMPGTGSGIELLICAVICQLPNNRDCMVPCLKHIRCVGLLADPIKAIGMIEMESETYPIDSKLRETLLQSNITPKMNLNRPNNDNMPENDESRPIELGDDNLADYEDSTPSSYSLESSQLVSTKTQIQDSRVKGSRPTVPGISSGLGGVKGLLNSMGGFLAIALALFLTLIIALLIKFIAIALELFVKLRCMLGFYMPQDFMAGMCGWRCTGKALCIFRCMDSFACCDLFLCTVNKLKKLGMNPISNLMALPGILTYCSDTDCHVSAFGCGKDGKHVPMFGANQIKLIKMMFGSDADVMEGIEKQQVFPFWMFRLVSQELSMGQAISAISSIGNDYDDHMKRVMYYMGQ